jgi:phosphatidylglycerol lysyltransferase
MIRRIFGLLGPLAGIALFAASFITLQHELRTIHYHQILAQIDYTPAASVFLAMLVTVVNFFALGGCEILGFRYLKSTLAPVKILVTAMIAASFSNTVGFSSVSATAVRNRIYSQEGLSTLDIAKLRVISSGITFWLGLGAVAGLLLLLNASAVAGALHCAPLVTRAAGWMSFGLVAAFIVVAAIKKSGVKIDSWEFVLPSPRLTLPLLFLACVDWASFGIALYVLLPPRSIAFPLFMAAFVAGQVAGFMSRIPGGIGVFEAVFLFLLRSFPLSPLVGALVIFRGVFYLLPLAASAVILGVYEHEERREKIGGVALAIGQWGRGVVPYFFAIMIFIGGMILLFSGATPAEHHRFYWLREVMPLPVVELSHFLASLIGMALLILSAGLYRRYDSAFHLTLYLLAGGAVFTFLKGIDYEEAIILTCMFAVLLPSRREFYRKGSFVHERLTLGWMVAVILALASSVWLGFFAYKHIAYSHDLWWQFSFASHASRFLRATVGASTLLFGYSMMRLLAPARVHPAVCRHDMYDLVKSILATSSSHSRSFLSLLDDKSFIVSEPNDAFLMYGVSGRSIVAMSDPVGNDRSFPSLVWRFKEMCDEHGGWPVFHEVGGRYLSLYLDIGLTLLKVGEEARVELREFSLESKGRKSLRYYSRRLSNEGWEVVIVPPHRVGAILPSLKAVSDSWLAKKHTREKRFSLGRFSAPYLTQTPIAVVVRDDTIVAFANLWLTATREEFSVDLMRYSEAAPESVMEYLFVRLIFWGREHGYRWFDLGMAPFSGVEDRQVAPLWNRFAAFLYAYGEEYYNFQGLRRFKEKFDPVWEPCYMAVPGGLTLPLILKDLSSLTSGGFKGVFAK